MEYEAVIGLETHVQLKTKSKMWCGCANAFGAPPNTNVCPVCLGLPGVLPVPNDEALRLTVLTGYLLNCEIPRFAKFDRKSYFYPDMPKNYQITQYDKPSTANGYVEFEFNGGRSRVRITRAHLEEDVGKSTHFERNSGVDFNRAGVPLMEIVSEPDLTSADMAYEYLNALKDILVYGGVSDCDMEKGMVRCDVNVSVRPKGTKELGAKIEIKNMNSFSGIRRALEYEIPRQIEVLTKGGKLMQSTRRWDDETGVTEEMRTKEDAHDYRYFPDPDLMPQAPTDEWLAEVKSRMVELPLARKQRFMKDYGLPASDAQTFVWDVPLGNYFEGIAKKSKNPKSIANWVINNLRAKLAEANERRTGVAPVSIEEEKLETGATPVLQMTLADLKFKPEAIVELTGLVENKTISSSAAQQVFAEMFETGKSPTAIVQEKGLAQVSDTGAIEKFCDEAIAANPGPAADFKAGKAAALNFLKGQVMKLSKGKANPALAGEILERKLRALGTDSSRQPIITPAAYPARNTEELEALRVFENLLDLKYAKPDLRRLDTRPNTDGTIEIVDEEQRPLGKIEVQVKKIPDGDTSYQCPVELIAYSERISLPFILVCVDVGNKKAYFRHLHRLMVPTLKPGQQSFVIKFDPKVHSVSGETQYRLQWLEIVQEYNRRISDYARLRQIENQLNPSHISKEDRIYFQEFIEHLNRFLDFDFPVVKEQFFKGVWKLGVGVSSADQNEVIFQIYTIQPGDPAILVSGIPSLSRTVSFGQDEKVFQYSFRARAALKSAKQEAASFVLGNLKKIIQGKKLSLCGKRMATEYLFWFVDHFGSSIGVEEADRLNVNQLNYGISIYLPAWASLAVPRFLGELIRLNKNNVQAVAPVLAAPPFEHIANTIPTDMLAVLPPELHPRHQLTKKEVLDLIKSGDNLRPVQVCFHEVSLQSLIEAVDYLLSTNQEWIERPYKPRTSVPDMVWSGYDVEALRHNIRTILVDSLDEYRMFVERNRIPLKNSLYLHQPTAIIYVANLTEWSNAKGFANSPYLKRYVVKNEDNKIPKVTLIDTSEAQMDFIVEKQILKFRRVEREIIAWEHGSPDYLFDKRPILTHFYSMLQNDLESEFNHGFT